MMLFEIKSRWDGSVLFSLECGSLKMCVEAAVKSRASLAGAYLARANLAGAYLACANLADAYLAGASLAGANLACAYLAGASLAGASLAGANLAGASLAGANLADAYLAGASLAGAKGFDPSMWLPQIRGSRHFVRMAGKRILKIGCIANPIEWWLENNVRCGEEHEYTPEQITEYRRYIELVAAMYPQESQPGGEGK